MGHDPKKKNKEQKKQQVAAPQQQRPRPYSGFLDQLRRATVAFCVMRPNPKPGEMPFTIHGSGIIVHPEVIFTAKHVLDGLEAAAAASGGTELPAVVAFPREPKITMGTIPGDPTSYSLQLDMMNVPITKWVKHDRADVAAVRVAKNPPTPLTTVPIEGSAPLYEGSEVVVCGFPYGMDVHEGKSALSSFSRGMVSIIVPHPNIPRALMAHYLLHMVVNPGNSGGPVVDPYRRTVYAIISRGIMNSGLVIAEPIHGPRGEAVMAECLDDSHPVTAPLMTPPGITKQPPSLPPTPGGHP